MDRGAWQGFHPWVTKLDTTERLHFLLCILFHNFYKCSMEESPKAVVREEADAKIGGY